MGSNSEFCSNYSYVLALPLNIREISYFIIPNNFSYYILIEIIDHSAGGGPIIWFKPRGHTVSD